MTFNTPGGAIHLRCGAAVHKGLLFGGRNRATQEAHGHKKPGSTEWETDALVSVPLSSPPTTLRATAAAAAVAARGAASGAKPQADESRSPTRDQQHSSLRRREPEAPRHTQIRMNRELRLALSPLVRSCYDSSVSGSGFFWCLHAQEAPTDPRKDKTRRN